MTTAIQEIIAVSATEHAAFGCPYCGYRSGYSHMSCQGTSSRTCGDCGKCCAVLAEGVTESAIGFGNASYHPRLQDHPRRGTPSHGREDKQPAGGGEFFTSRGLGLENTPGCFVCGGKSGLHNNIAAFVRTKAAGERVVTMFEMGARLDYRDFEPDRIQVKVGACGAHFPNLAQLDRLVEDGIVTKDKVKSAQEFKED